MDQVAFVGLGAMGQHMARHLHRAGVLRALCNRTHAKAQALAHELNAPHAGQPLPNPPLPKEGEGDKRGAHARGENSPPLPSEGEGEGGVGNLAPVLAIADARELPNHANIVITCVTADADVIALAEALAKNAKPGLVMIDMSTIASTSARRAAEILRATGADFIDAPVSGGVEGAKNAKLSVMAGGDATTLERVRPVLELLAARITHMGPVGAGSDTKAVNQVLVAGIAQAVCEGLALGEALGLPADKLLPTLAAGAAANWFLDKRGATMLADNFTPGFKLGLLHKDLLIVRQLTDAAGTDRTIIEASIADYAELMRRGHADEDTSALIRLKRKHW